MNERGPWIPLRLLLSRGEGKVTLWPTYPGVLVALNKALLTSVAFPEGRLRVRVPFDIWISATLSLLWVSVFSGTALRDSNKKATSCVFNEINESADWLRGWGQSAWGLSGRAVRGSGQLQRCGKQWEREAGGQEAVRCYISNTYITDHDHQRERTVVHSHNSTRWQGLGWHVYVWVCCNMYH